MKRKLFILLAIAAMAFGGTLISCDTPVDPNEQEQPEDPNDPVNPGQPGNVEEGAQFTINASVPTPVNAWNLKSDGGDTSVSVNVKTVDYENFVFSCHPGASVQSYYLDVYPLAMLYNSLFEAMKSQEKTTITEEEVHEMIIGFLQEPGSGGYAFGPTDNSDAALAEFQNREFNWGQSNYAQFNIVPDAEYIIATLGCFDNQAQDVADLTLTYVKTPVKEIIGSPEATITTFTTWTSAQFTYVPNTDCKYISYYCSSEADLMPYINAYGDKQFINVMRHYQDVIVANHTEPFHQFNISFQNPDPSQPLMATAVCMDANKTPCATYHKEIFTLLEREDIVPAADCSITVDTDKVSATVAWFNWQMGKDLRAVYYNTYTVEQWNEMSAGADEDALVEITKNLDLDGAWGIANKNFKYDLASDTVLGTEDQGRELMVSLTPGVEYVIVYGAKDVKYRYTAAKASEPFTTDDLVATTPELCESTMSLELVPIAPSAVRWQFTLDHEDTACYRFQYIEGFAGPTTPSVDADRNTFVNWLTGLDAMEGSNSNYWWTVPGESAEESRWDDFACSPNTKYTMICVAEDWNGVLGDVIVASCTTPGLEGGPNPQVTVEGELVDVNGTEMVKFTGSMIQDCKMLYFYVLDSDDSEYINSYLKPRYASQYASKYDYDTASSALATYIVSNGSPTYKNSDTMDPSTGLFHLGSDVVRVGIAVGVGVDADGNDVFSEPAILVWDTEKFRTLKSYYE